MEKSQPPSKTPINYQINSRSLTDYLAKNFETVSKIFMDVNETYFDYDRLRANTETIQNMVEYTLKTQNSHILKWLQKFVLKKPIQWENHFPEYIKQLYADYLDDSEDAPDICRILIDLGNTFKLDRLGSEISKEDEQSESENDAPNNSATTP